MRDVQRFEYLQDAALKFGQFYFVDEIEAFLDRATSTQLAELSNAYAAIDSRNDAPELSRWIRTCQNGGSGTEEEELEFASRVGQLFVLFRRLADRNVQPFSNGRVRFEEVSRPPDWNNVPKELDYLLEPAESYGCYATEHEMIAFLENATDSDTDLLARTAERLRLSGDKRILDSWLDKNLDGDHEEAWRVYCLLGVMDHAGLDFEPPG